MGNATTMPGCDKMTSQCALMANASLISENGEYRMTMQGDGNLVLYNSNDEPLWASGTNGDYGAHCVFQEDGHFLVYRCDEDGRVSSNPDDCIWKTDIFGDPADFHHGWVCMQNDGNFVQTTGMAPHSGAPAPMVANKVPPLVGSTAARRLRST